jgi:peptidoglycan L-alanyl-D-glutamate endopeptidase CwlK
VSSRSLDDLRPEVRPLVDAFLASCAAAGADLIVTCTLRSNDEQTALYAQGRTKPGHIVTNAKAGQSAHNYGLALDIVPIANGKPDWNGSDPVWKTIGDLGVAAGLTWLGSPGSTFPEEPHFEHPDWRSLAGLDA